MITIQEFMTEKPYTLLETDLVTDARQIMTEKNIRHIPVTDSDKHLLGLVTQRDVLAATGPGSMQESEADLNIKLADIMIRNVRVIGEDDSLRQAAVYMQSHKYGCLPVISNDCLVGIITDSDFVAIAINLLEQAEQSEEYIGAGEEIDVLELPGGDEVH